VRLLAALKKEALALSRDLHALVALFILPTVFILVMSLALQDAFTPASASKFSYLVDDRDQSGPSRQFVQQFASESGFSAALAGPGTDPMTALRARRADFVLTVAPGFARRLHEADGGRGAGGAPLISVTGEPGLSAQALALAQAQAELALSRVTMQELTRELGMELARRDKGSVASEHLPAQGARLPPTSVQQSVPAWLTFAMFFVVIPVSTVFTAERDHGTLLRLRAMGVSVPLFFAGKVVPFFVINLVQALAMLAVGVWVVPLCGGQALRLDGSHLALAFLIAATSLAAIGYALLVAVCAQSVAQATIIGGLGNVILGAVGGVMAPKFLMPETMQTLTNLSPMAWALDGMLDVLLRGAGVATVAPRLLALIAFASACLGVAALVFRRRNWRP